MLKMIKGCEVPKAETLCEEYVCRDNRITANINADKIERIVKDFIAYAKEPLFFILELPTNINDEPDPENVLHNDVYYIDGCSYEKSMKILKDNKELLINDGPSRFGFGSHINGDEIMVCSYNIVYLFSKCIEDFTDIFDNNDIPRRDKITTAYDTFSEEYPGTASTYTAGEKNIYSLPETLKQDGIYFAERRKK